MRRGSETMSRPRSSDPAKPLTFSMPTSLHTRLNNHISFEMSRSAWIASAIQSKLDRDGHATIEHWTTDEILEELWAERFNDDVSIRRQIEFIREQLNA